VRDGPIDLAPLQMTEINSEGVCLVARPGFELAIQRVGDDLLAASIEGLCITAYGSTRQALADSLELAIAGTWRQYFESDSEGPDPKINEMRYQLITRFRPY